MLDNNTSFSIELLMQETVKELTDIAETVGALRKETELREKYMFVEREYWDKLIQQGGALTEKILSVSTTVEKANEKTSV